MASTSRAKHPVKGWLRPDVRLPLWLYRAHLGWLPGSHFLRLTHSGRKSGQLRQTVLEVVDHDRATDCWVSAT